MLDISNVPNVDSHVKIKRVTSLDGIYYYKLLDEQTDSRVYFYERDFKKYFKAFKDVIKNQDKYCDIFYNARDYKWFKLRNIDRSLTNSGDWFRLDRVPIYIEMFKHISKCKVYLDREHLLSQNLFVLEEVSKRIKTRKKLSKVDNKPYINL